MLTQGLSGLPSVAQQAFKSGRALAGSVPPARRVVDGSKQWWYGFGSGEGGFSGLFSPRLFGKVSGLRSAATDCAISRCG